MSRILFVMRRMEQTADRLEREVWPVAGARRFVLAFPLQVRHWLARSPDLLSDVILHVTDVIKEFYENSTLRGTDVDHASSPASGAITFVQLFGSALNLNPHLHMIFLDGVFAQTVKGKRFYTYQAFETDSVLGFFTPFITDLISCLSVLAMSKKTATSTMSRLWMMMFLCRSNHELLSPTGVLAVALLIHSSNKLTPT